MATHLTLRMAWHDSGWNGKICARPQDNPYCVGSHSLLSERMARDKNLEVETVQAGQSLDSLMPDYLPPCYWSTNAMSAEQASVVHVHPFPDLKDKRIDDELPPYAAFTWPFRLSFNHRKETKKRDGLYPRDLEKNVSGFFEKLKPKPPTSFVFFYLNYDNPVSADEYKYALVGCAKVTGVGDPTQFSFSEAELSAKRNSPKTKYFPTMNWAIRISSSFAESGIRLPYHEYLAHMQTHPEDEPKLEEMRVLIDEPPLVRRFKYVAEEVDDDRCLYLLYKLRKAIKIVQEQGIVSMDREESLIEHYIGEVWQRRGLYPGLDSVLRLLVGLSAQGEDPAPIAAIQDFLEAAQASLPDAKELLTEVFALLTGERNLPEELAPYRPLIRKAKRGLSDHIGLLDVLKKLTLFALTEFQLKRILFPDATDKGMHPFRGQSVRAANIAKNPYLLCEKYVPVGSDQASRDTELEQPHIRDGSIGLFDIDIGMFPDERFIERDDELQDLTPASPERLRALVVEYLRVRSSAGDCYASLPDVHKFLVGQALFYARDLLIAAEQLLSPRHREHLSERLEIVDYEADTYFYLREVREAEKLVESVVKALIEEPDTEADIAWIDGYVSAEAVTLAGQVKDFDAKGFCEERSWLLEAALKRAFLVVTGKPGSGKTFALKRLLEVIRASGETVTVLTPTGKATLRVRQEAEFAEAQTIDMFLYRAGGASVLEDFEGFTAFSASKAPPIENLVIDESSMVDLPHLALLFKMLQRQGLKTVHRVILVGDENQLPPIGLGRPYYDIVTWIKEDGHRRQRSLIHLQTNCRQRFDSTVLDLAQLFVGKNRYYEEILGRLRAGGKISDWLTVNYWSSAEELLAQIDDAVGMDICSLLGQQTFEPESGLNKLFGLYDTGFIPNNSPTELSLDAWQVISPYRGGNAGTLRVNRYISDRYRTSERTLAKFSGGLKHSDKVIRLSNWYGWSRSAGRGELILSNGSVGVVCDHPGRRALYFPDASDTIWWSRLDDPEQLDLAYAITVHKSQGSEFDNVFAVFPDRQALLSRELVYTALTRSTGPLTLFIQKTERDGPLDVARTRSALLARNTSLFQDPRDWRRFLEPEPGVFVSSKIEYIIYRSLRSAQEAGHLTFGHEIPLDLKQNGTIVRIRPDFTIYVEGRTYYWEHLGMLDCRDYHDDWLRRRQLYRDNGLEDSLITTDDLNGVKQERIEQVIEEIAVGKIVDTAGSRFSLHHVVLGD